VLNHGHAAELRERRFEVVQLQGVWPVVFVWSSEHLENFEDLIDFTVAHEQWPSLNHLSENAASRPKIDAKGVCLLAEQNFGATVPKCDDLVGVGLDGQAKSTGKTKVS